MDYSWIPAASAQFQSDLGVGNRTQTNTKAYTPDQFNQLFPTFQNRVNGSPTPAPSLAGAGDVGNYFSQLYGYGPGAMLQGAITGRGQFGYDQNISQMSDLFKQIARAAGIQSGATTAGVGGMTDYNMLNNVIRQGFAPQELQRQNMLLNFLNAGTGQGANFLTQQGGLRTEQMGIQSREQQANTAAIASLLSALRPQLYQEQQLKPGWLARHAGLSEA